MKRMIPLILALVLLLTACGRVSPRELTSAYAQMEAEKGQDGATAIVLYNMETASFTPTEKVGNDETFLWILPKFVGDTLRLYTVEAVGSESYQADGEHSYTYEVQKDTVIQLCWMYLRHNQMWYLEIESPDGEVYGSPLPYFCETKEDVIYIGEHWDGKDNLPDDWGEEEEIVPTLKPVIYLYPQEPTEVSVVLDYEGTLICTYPKYENGWTVTAYPDGTLVDAQGKEYNYLYWDGLDSKNSDFSRGFCVPGEETAAFLEVALEKLGLNRREANEFIVYWLPLMEQNPYNVISFQTTAYTDIAKLHITPAPDTLIRVFMAWYGTEEPVSIPEQELTAPERHGFTVVEWGGELRGE